MIAIALALSLSSPIAPLQSPSSNPVGRIFTTESIHVGLRSAALVTPGEIAIGITIQVSTKAL